MEYVISLNMLLGLVWLYTVIGVIYSLKKADWNGDGACPYDALLWPICMILGNGEHD